MKILSIFIAFCFLLSGCAAVPSDRELVEDSILEVSAWPEEEKKICVELPGNAEIVFETDDRSCYSVDDGEFEIVTDRFLCSDPKSAVRRLSGFEPERLNTVAGRSSFGDELFVTWCAAGEDGNRVYTADIITDELYTFCVICSFSETANRNYDEEIRNIFSSFDVWDENMA